MEYLEILYKEYLKTLNNTNKSQYILQEGFNNWLEERINILPYYEKFLQSYDLIPSKGIIEIDKSEKDSILSYTPFETKGLLVSKYVKTKKLEKKGIINIKGKIVLVRDNKNTDIMIDYQGKKINVNHIKNFITQFPFDENTLKIMIELMNTDKNVFIGTYGKINEKNRMDNLKKLYDLKNEINRQLHLNIEGEVVYTREYYLAAITPKLKYKEKIK